jgi:hypothetical protein
MEDRINFTKIIYAALIYSISVIIIGYFVPELEPYAAIIAALGAGVYAGYSSKTMTGTANGFLAGLIGGIVTGVASISVKSIAGIPISVSVASFLQPVISSITPSSQLFSATALVVIGLFFGTVGGFLGSIRFLRPLFLFSTMFLLFILLGAVDNAAWNLSTPGWTWMDSFSHVFHNEIDIAVAVVFAFVVTIITYVMNLFKKRE